MVSSYPSIFNLGHKAIADLLKSDVIVEEKVDGSQFGFMVHSDSGELQCRSKGAVLYNDAPQAMFIKAVETAKKLAPILKKGWTYRGEYLQSPKHNSLAYDRTPKDNIIIFDIQTGIECYLSPEDKLKECERIGLECVPVLFKGKIDDANHFRSFLDTVSVLGGQKIEGVVIKPSEYNLFGPDKKCLLGKFVSEAFKEVHSNEWKNSNPTGSDILSLIGIDYGTPARWNKAIQHLREDGKIQDDPKDIGALMKEIPNDVRKECEQEIKDRLWVWAWPHISRSICKGFPQWYKDELLKKQFEEIDHAFLTKDA